MPEDGSLMAFYEAPKICPKCGRKLIFAIWGQGNFRYLIYRCDGFIGSLPYIGYLYRCVAFWKGKHYTFSMPPITENGALNKPQYEYWHYLTLSDEWVNFSGK